MPWDKNNRWYEGTPADAPDAPAGVAVVPPTRMEPVAAFPGLGKMRDMSGGGSFGNAQDRQQIPAPVDAGTVFDTATESAERLMGFLVLTSTKLDDENRYFRLRKGVNFIGRFGSRSQVEIRDQQVSAQHALIVCTSKATRLLDLDSSNGIQVNGSSIEYYVLQEGDRIRIGTNELAYIPFPFVAED